MKKTAFIAVFLASWLSLYAQTDGMIHVEGVVRSVVEDIALPFCDVQLRVGDVVVASARSGYDGCYVMPRVKVGEYTLMVTQFGDTLQNFKGLLLMRDTRVTSLVSLPDASQSQIWLPTDLKQINLREVWICTSPQNKLAKMGLLITSPDDQRLWNFSGKMIDSGPASADLSWPTISGRNPYLRHSILTPPIWEWCNEPWNPVPVVKDKEEKANDVEERLQEED